MVGWLFRFDGISTFVGYLMPNSFLYELFILFQTIQLSMSTVRQKRFSLKLFSFVKQF